MRLRTNEPRTAPDAPADDNREPSLRDTLDAVRNMDSPGVTTTDVRIVLGCSPDTARRRLGTLFDEGYVNQRNTGQQTLRWDAEREPSEERNAATHVEPVSGPGTDAVELIEASRDDE